jgi:hypothetical protein
MGFVRPSSQASIPGLLALRVKVTMSHSSTMSKESISIRYDEVPLFLRGSAFYLQLVADDEQSGLLTIPQACFKTDDTVNGLEDLSLLLHAMLFWGIDAIPDCVLDFCHHHDLAVWQETTEDLPDSCPLHEILTSCFDGTENILPAVNSGHPELVKHWMKVHPYENLSQPTQPCEDVASVGHLQLLRELHEHDYPWNAQACEEAARGGHLNCLMYLHEEGCLWDRKASSAAAERGHLECLQYLYNNGCQWFVDEVGVYASLHGHLACLKFAHEHDRGRLDVHISMTLHLDCLRYALENGCPIHTQVSSGQYLAYRSIEMIVLLQKHGIVWGKDICVVSLECPLKYTHFFVVNGCFYDETITGHAVRKGRAEHLAYLIDDALLPMSAKLFSEAVLYGSVDCVQVLVDRGCPCHFVSQTKLDGQNLQDEHIMHCIQYAAERGWGCSEDLIDFVFANDLPLCQDYMREEAIVYDNVPATLPQEPET